MNFEHSTARTRWYASEDVACVESEEREDTCSRAYGVECALAASRDGIALSVHTFDLHNYCGF